MAQNELVRKMFALADKDALPENHPMRMRAKDFLEADEKYFSDPPLINPPQFLGAWARARKCWCEYTGEPLV